MECVNQRVQTLFSKYLDSCALTYSVPFAPRYAESPQTSSEMVLLVELVPEKFLGVPSRQK